MSELGWRREYVTGEEDIDAQHKQILEIFETLAAAVGRTDEADVLGETVEAMAGYVEEHFGLEERLMADSGYPGFDAHHDLHRGFVRQVLQLQRSLRADDVTPELLAETVTFLQRWFVEHITVADQAYVPHLRAHGKEA